MRGFFLHLSIMFDNISHKVYIRGHWQSTAGARLERAVIAGVIPGDRAQGMREMGLSVCRLSVRTPFLGIKCTWAIEGFDRCCGQISPG